MQLAPASQPSRRPSSRSLGSILAALALSAVLLVHVKSAHAQTEQALTADEQETVDAYHVMQGVTAGLLATTATLGLVQLYNLPTTFGDGACARDAAIFGQFACSGQFSIIHGAFGVASLGSMVATGILALEAPDLDQGDEDIVTDVLGIGAMTTIGLTGVLGILAANPGLFGVSQSGRQEFSRHVRLVHMILALTTASLFATHIAVDHID